MDFGDFGCFMKAEERAERAVDAMARRWSDYNRNEMVAQFRDAIKTAIEEDRASRECCKAERAACLEIIDGIYDKLEPGAVSRCGGLLLDAAMDIRARSNTN